jgi:integrase/recombinase XerD
MGSQESDRNIYWRDGIAYARVWIGGKEYRRSLQTRDPEAARAKLADWRSALEKEAAAPPDASPSWKEAVILWSEMVLDAPDGLKPRVKERYRCAVRIMSTFFGERRLSEIDKKSIGQWARMRRKGEVVVEDKPLRPATNATIRRDLTALSSVFRCAVANGLHDSNPAKEWDRSVIPEKRAPFYVPTLAEIERVASASAPGMAAMIRFASNTGCRLEEAASLEHRDVRPDRGEVIFARTKTNRPRVVALVSPGGDATASIQALPRHLKIGWVFWHDMGERYLNASGIFRETVSRVAKAEKIAGRELRPFSFHKLRHAFAIRWLENGGDIYALSKHLGHTSVKTTEIYLSYIRDGVGGSANVDEAEEAAEAVGTGTVMAM